MNLLATTTLLFLVVILTITSAGTNIQYIAMAKSDQGEAHDQDENSNANSNSNNDEEEEETTDSSSEETTNPDSSNNDNTNDNTNTQELAAANEPNDPTPGIGNNDKPNDAPNPQPNRVGSHDTQTSPTSNPGPTATDPTLCTITTNPDCSTSVDKNCFGKVISERAQDHKEDPEEGTLGSHARDPVPELEGNETPRQGIGNQDQGHPSAHGAFNSQFEEEDEQNVIDNC